MDLTHYKNRPIIFRIRYNATDTKKTKNQLPDNSVFKHLRILGLSLCLIVFLFLFFQFINNVMSNTLSKFFEEADNLRKYLQTDAKAKNDYSCIIRYYEKLAKVQVKKIKVS